MSVCALFELATRSDVGVDFGAVVTYNCESGYSVDGTVSGNNTFDLSCGELGFTEEKSCTPVKYSKPSQWLSDDGTARAEWTTDSPAKLGDVRHLEPLEFRCLVGFSLDGSANPVQLVGPGMCEVCGVFPRMGKVPAVWWRRVRLGV